MAAQCYQAACEDFSVDIRSDNWDRAQDRPALAAIVRHNMPQIAGRLGFLSAGGWSQVCRFLIGGRRRLVDLSRRFVG
jgi:hypothetical protein